MTSQKQADSTVFLNQILHCMFQNPVLGKEGLVASAADEYSRTILVCGNASLSKCHENKDETYQCRLFLHEEILSACPPL